MYVAIRSSSVSAWLPDVTVHGTESEAYHYLAKWALESSAGPGCFGDDDLDEVGRIQDLMAECYRSGEYDRVTAVYESNSSSETTLQVWSPVVVAPVSVFTDQELEGFMVCEAEDEVA